MDVNWDGASDDRDRWFDLWAEQCDAGPNKWQLEDWITEYMSAF